MQRKLNVAMAGGGTGGHIMPIQSLLEYLDTKPEFSSHVKSVYWFGSRQSLEQKIAMSMISKSDKNSTKLKFVSIFSGKFRRETKMISILKNICDLFFLSVGFLQSLFFLQKFRIDVVFCKGGYVALPLVLAAALLRKKIVVHESDVHPGLVNRIASKFATKSFAAFEAALSHSQIVGQILSDKLILRASDNLDSNEKTKIFVTGGSQGSKILYETLIDIVTRNQKIDSSFEFFITLGTLNKDLGKKLSGYKNIHVFEFLSQEEMGYYYNICDISISRAGTTSLAEQKLFGLKIIMIPIPWTHDQYDNAKRYQKKYNDILIDQNSKTFQKDLETSLLSLCDYQKKANYKDLKKVIQTTKDIIWKSILN